MPLLSTMQTSGTNSFSYYTYLELILAIFHSIDMIFIKESIKHKILKDGHEICHVKIKYYNNNNNNFQKILWYI